MLCCVVIDHLKCFHTIGLFSSIYTRSCTGCSIHFTGCHQLIWTFNNTYTHTHTHQWDWCMSILVFRIECCAQGVHAAGIWSQNLTKEFKDPNLISNLPKD